MNELRICLAGEFRSGKSTVADFAREVYNMVPFAFGDALKEEFHELYKEIKPEPKPRKGYQYFGQKKRLLFGEDIWLNKCFDEIERIRQAANAYNITGTEVEFMPIITDARQPNEFERCREEDYVIIKIVASPEVRIARAEAEGDDFDLEDMNHETEQYIRELTADYNIFNNGSLEDLYEQFSFIVQSIRNENKRKYGEVI